MNLTRTSTINATTMTLSTILLVAAAVTTGLMAGLFSAWSYAVSPGLARVNDVTFITSMQAMNRAILNPVFLLCFLGTALLLPLNVYLHYRPSLPARFWLLLAAALLYIVGVIGITMGGNVPLNEALDAFRLETASPEEIARQRQVFEAPWNRLNAIRTVASLLAFGLTVAACAMPVHDE
jgi:uncharacterized membrane protein